jgi:hypothetical protein
LQLGDLGAQRLDGAQQLAVADVAFGELLAPQLALGGELLRNLTLWHRHSPGIVPRRVTPGGAELNSIKAILTKRE